LDEQADDPRLILHGTVSDHPPHEYPYSDMSLQTEEDIPRLLGTNSGFNISSFMPVVKRHAVFAGNTLVSNDQAGKGEYFSSG
jgi:hypothetical protein